jgi:hypothetical protein
MKTLTSSDFLDLWERGVGLHPLDQGLLILGSGLPGTSCDSMADWPLGRRNAALAGLRCACFGSSVQAWTACEKCGAKLELDLDGRSLADGSRVSEPIAARGYTFRLPTTRDLAAAARGQGSDSAVVRLLDSCCFEAGEPDRWSEEDVEEIGQKMALADPMAEILLTLTCPECKSECRSALDIAGFFWEEIAARAKRLLREVHDLASAYGWTEREVLSLNEHRRALYLGMVRE